MGFVLEFLSKMMDFKVFGGSVLGCLFLFLRGGEGGTGVTSSYFVSFDLILMELMMVMMRRRQRITVNSLASFMRHFLSVNAADLGWSVEIFPPTKITSSNLYKHNISSRKLTCPVQRAHLKRKLHLPNINFQWIS